MPVEVFTQLYGVLAVLTNQSANFMTDHNAKSFSVVRLLFSAMQVERVGEREAVSGTWHIM